MPHVKQNKTMKIYRATIPRKDIETLPEKELVFFIQACRILNDINILHKTTKISNKFIESEVERKAQNSQTLFFFILLTGKLFEGWDLLKTSFFRSKVSKSYEVLLPKVAQDSLKKLKNYFGNNNNMIKKVGNWIAFHYESNKLLEQIKKLPDDENFEIYLNEYQGNCFYYIPNVLLMNAILDWSGVSEPLQALNKYFDEVTSVACWYINFLGPCLSRFAENKIKWEFKEIEIPDPPAINSIFLPYFVGTPLSLKEEKYNKKM
jgi:hypothetical protein